MRTQTINVMIDGQEVPMRVSAATPIIYRNEFHKDMFKTLDGLSGGEPITDDKGDVVAVTIPEGAVEAILELAYVMAKQGDPKLKVSFVEWLEGFSFEAITSGEVLQPILQMLNNDKETIVESKKKVDQQSDQ